jgi:hypothetical protein
VPIRASLSSTYSVTVMGALGRELVSPRDDRTGGKRQDVLLRW